MTRAPRQNRVLPTGEITAHPARGLFTGNRGILELTDGRLGTSRWKHKHWIICTLTHPRGRYHGPEPARGWTPLFFLDEAVGLAAGHRPCAYCRPKAYGAYKSAWARATGAATGQTIGHLEIDTALHAARVTRTRQQVTHEAPAEALPDGTMILHRGLPALIRRGRCHRFTPEGYDPPTSSPSGPVTVLTPAPSVAVLRAGFRPQLHPSCDI